MRKKLPLTALFAVFVFFLNPSRGFTQQQPLELTELSNELGALATEMASTASFMAGTGLNWEEIYIGQLVDIPSHWGIGLTAGATTSKVDNLNLLLSKFGYEADGSFASKQILPMYTVELRLGGFNMVPFDIGLKFGMLPYLPIFANSIDYEANVYGLDFRLQIVQETYNFPAISIGLEIDHAAGGLRRTTSTTITTNMGDIVINGGTTGVVWDAWVFNLKLMAAKNLWEPKITIFGGLRAGAAISKTAYQFTGGNSISIGGNLLADTSIDQQEDIREALQATAGSNTTFEVTEEKITGWSDAIGVNVSLHQGIAFRFDYTSLSASLMIDVINFEMGANISFKYMIK